MRISLKILKGKKFKINNNNKLDKKSKLLLDNHEKETERSQPSDKSQHKAALIHPLLPPGLSEDVGYSKEIYLSKIRKYGSKIQKGRGANEWIKKWNKKF